MFPLKLYKNCEYYVPPFLCDERFIFDKEKNANLDGSEVVFFLAYNEKDEVVGRIGGILHHTANEINNQKKGRECGPFLLTTLSIDDRLFVDQLLKIHGEALYV